MIIKIKHMNISSIKNNYNSLSRSQKKGAGTPAYTRFINRFLGRLIASFLAEFNISPNTISVVSGLITISSFILFLIIPTITFWHSLILVLLLYFGYALDSADGQLARLLKKQSKHGDWLDHTFDAVKIPLSQGVAAFYIVTNLTFLSTKHIIFYLMIISLACANYMSGILKSKLLVSNNKSFYNDKSKSSNIFRSFITLPLDYGIFISMFLFTYNTKLFFVIYSLWGIVFILYSLLLLLKSWRELKNNTIV